MMKLPNQATPVSRNITGKIKDFEQPREVINFLHASFDSKFELVANLQAGANYNAPMRFLTPVDSCGCHILSESSMALCLDACGFL